MSAEDMSATTPLETVATQPRLVPAIFAGAGAALIGAVIWAVVTVTTKYQIGFMAIGVGYIVGYAVRTIGRGSAVQFGVAGAVLALVGCVLGNVLSTCGFISIQESVGIWEVLGRLNPAMIVDLIVSTFDGMDLLFYGIAVYEGYKLSLYRG